MNSRWLRRIFQTGFFLFLIYTVWQTKQPLTGFVNPNLYFQADPFLVFITVLAERVVIPGILIAAGVLLLTLVFGRVFCGWFCPLGFTLDIWAKLLKVLRVKKTVESNDPSKLVNTKHLVLGLVFLCALFGLQIAWALDPIAIFVRTTSFVFHPFVAGSVDSSFAWLLEKTSFSFWLENAYNFTRENFIGFKVPNFSNKLTILSLFVAILLLSLIKRRFWCRYLCPAGAMLALVSKVSPFQRYSKECKPGCSACSKLCRMNAIKSDNTYLKQECILCMDCTNLCPAQTSEFAFKKPQVAGSLSNKGFSRFDFLAWFAGFIVLITGFNKLFASANNESTDNPVRPPGALVEAEFKDRCVRCGNCMKVCPTNVLQPALFEGGLDGIWSPLLNMQMGYCEYSCNLCTKVCPTGAIKELLVNDKKNFKIGKAIIDKELCVVWKDGTECIVCEEHCPIGDKAIKTQKTVVNGRQVNAPVVDEKLCIGCGICQYMCPTKPKRSVVVKTINM